MILLIRLAVYLSLIVLCIAMIALYITVIYAVALWHKLLRYLAQRRVAVWLRCLCLLGPHTTWRLWWLARGLNRSGIRIGTRVYQGQEC